MLILCGLKSWKTANKLLSWIYSILYIYLYNPAVRKICKCGFILPLWLHTIPQQALEIKLFYLLMTEERATPSVVGRTGKYQAYQASMHGGQIQRKNDWQSGQKASDVPFLQLNSRIAFCFSSC